MRTGRAHSSLHFWAATDETINEDVEENLCLDTPGAMCFESPRSSDKGRSLRQIER